MHPGDYARSSGGSTIKRQYASSIENEIVQVVRDMNRAWLKDDLEGLRRHFHEEVTFVAPNGIRVGSGIDDCVKSYEDFLLQAEVLGFEFTHIQADIVENTAVATSRFRIVYSMKGKKHQEDGSEILVLSKESGRWLVIWRMILAADSR